MTPKELSKLLKVKSSELQKLCNRKLPIKIGVMAQSHFQDNFVKGGFVNNGLTRWDKSKRESSNSPSAKYGTLMSGKEHLRRQINYSTSAAKVRVYNNVVYAAIHNEGGEVNAKITPKMRRFAWAKFFEGAGITKSDSKADKKSKIADASDDAKMWRGLALTKKSELKYEMPKRQFIGESTELNDEISKMVDKEIRKTLNL